MNGFQLVVASIYDIGFLASFWVYWGRARPRGNGPNWREYLLANLPFFALMICKAFTWPAVLGYWWFTGKQPSPWRAFYEFQGRPVRKVARVGGLSDEAKAEMDAEPES